MRAILLFPSTLALWLCPSAVLGNRVFSGRLEDSEPPSKEGRADERFQCDRQCRWKYGFTDRSIVGKRVAKISFVFDGKGRYCTCFKGAEQLGTGSMIPRHGEKSFDTENTWSGGQDFGFDTELVCTQAPEGNHETMDREMAVREKKEILHCGACAACSSKHDIDVIAKTRHWITEVMTKVSATYAAPWGHGNAQRLAADLEDVGIDFSRTRADGRTDLPTCMDCWTDNIMCDSETCKEHCWVKFFNAANPKTNITGDASFFDFNAKCLKCDELNCGAEFIKCAGANRRSSGILSDIKRPERQQCTVGIYYDVLPDGLPTAVQPTVAEIDQVDAKNKARCAQGKC